MLVILSAVADDLELRFSLLDSVIMVLGHRVSKADIILMCHRKGRRTRLLSRRRPPSVQRDCLSD